MNVFFAKALENAVIPQKSTLYSAGFDLYSFDSVTILPGQRVLVSTGIHAVIPSGYVGLIWPRSGLALSFGIDTLAGVIDSDYRGEIKVILYNTGDNIFISKAGSKIAQLLIQRCEIAKAVEVEMAYIEEDKTDRGDGGFGSTGE